MGVSLQLLGSGRQTHIARRVGTSRAKQAKEDDKTLIAQSAGLIQDLIKLVRWLLTVPH